MADEFCNVLISISVYTERQITHPARIHNHLDRATLQTKGNIIVATLSQTMQEAISNKKFSTRRRVHFLQQDHGHTRGEGTEHVHAQTHNTRVEARDGKTGSSASRARGRAGFRGLGSRCDGTSA
jgi:hypothetical protein